MVLAKMALSPGIGSLICIDIQSNAISCTQQNLMTNFPEVIDRVKFVHGSHADLPKELVANSVSLFVYNLGKNYNINLILLNF